MSLYRGFPWVALVLAAPALAGAQVTVSDQETDARMSGRPRATVTLDGSRRTEGTASVTPEFHTVVPGDTLWDLSGYYHGSPWRWPGVWALNPQITNPHWIFPGDQVRLLRQGTVAAQGPARPATIRSVGNRLTRPPPRYPRGTIFMREEAWASPEAVESSGTIVGSPDDQMLLSEGDQIYLEFHRRAPNVGETYTIYSEGQATQGSDRNAGRVVRVIGSTVIDAWDPQRRLATGRITESIDTIERGERVAIVQRQFQPVPPSPNDRDMVGHVVATPIPRAIVGRDFVVIVDRGEQDGVQLGNRFFLTQRDDPWIRSVEGQARLVRRTELDRDGDGEVDYPPGVERLTRDNLPVEVIGEMMVVALHPRTSVCLMTQSQQEVEVGQPVVMRRGY